MRTASSSMSGASTNTRGRPVSGARPRTKMRRTTRRPRATAARRLLRADMRYIELTATVAPADVERAAEVLRAVAGGGVSIETPFLQRSLELGAEPRADAPALVRAYVRDGDPRGDVLLVAGEALRRAAIAAELTHRTVHEEDWAESWKEHFHIERFGRIVVVPSWREYTPQPDDVVVTLDP